MSNTSDELLSRVAIFGMYAPEILALKKFIGDLEAERDALMARLAQLVPYDAMGDYGPAKKGEK